MVDDDDRTILVAHSRLMDLWWASQEQADPRVVWDLYFETVAAVLLADPTRSTPVVVVMSEVARKLCEEVVAAQ